MSYIDHGDLPIDNSRLELKVRLFAVGRKLWLLASPLAGAHASALICSLLGLVKANGKEPYARLCNVLERVPLDQAVENYEALLLCNVHVQNLATNLLAREQWG